jgi:4-amino-4-deoxychorismate lyase
MFLESICILNGIPQNPEAHRERMCLTAAHHGFTVPLLPHPSAFLPPHLTRGKVKWRILYGRKIELMEFLPYRPKEVRSLRLVEASPDYAYKYADRTALETLLQQKGNCDEILIVRNGQITDTSYSNVVLQQNDRYYTPSSFLLNGTKRQQLLREGRISEKEIRAEELHRYNRILLINAMLDVDDAQSIPISNIYG